ncbi:hypothetical protein BRAO285_1270060 [Bradyrhizobium sp. ORS 285]|nr:hypothetical protein BRAO285_1270060 [Bradyrhizobium sp. ORS 285]
MRWPREIAASSHEGADERSHADVKSQRPDTPKLVSTAQCASIVAAWWPTSRRTRETAYKRQNHRAGKAGRFSAAPVVPAACIFLAGGPQASADAWPSLRPLHLARGMTTHHSGPISRGNANACLGCLRCEA